jgi:hypothetical protein
MSNIISIPLNKSGGESIDDLASSILVHGLIHNLTVVEQLAANGENSGKYEVATKREFLSQIFAALVVKIIPALRRKQT